MIDRLFYIGAASAAAAWTTAAQAQNEVRNYKVECSSGIECHVTGPISFIVRNTINDVTIVPNRFTATKNSSPIKKEEVSVASIQIPLKGGVERYVMSQDGKIAESHNYKTGRNISYITTGNFLNKLKRHDDVKVYVSYIADMDSIGNEVVNLKTKQFVSGIEKALKYLKAHTKRAG